MMQACSLLSMAFGICLFFIYLGYLMFDSGHEVEIMGFLTVSYSLNARRWNEMISFPLNHLQSFLHLTGPNLRN